MNRDTWVFWEMERKDNCWLDRGYYKEDGKWIKTTSLDKHCINQRYMQSNHNKFKD